MTVKELIEQLEQFPPEHEALIYISFRTRDDKQINMGEISDIENIFPNGDSVNIEVRCEAWDSAFDQAMIKEQFIDEDGTVTDGPPE